MQVHINSSNGLPIYEQIVRQVKFAIANSSLQVGERVPSVREMAAHVAVNPNTVARAYRDLQADGVLVPIRGTGLAVTADAVAKCRAERLEMIRQRLRSVLGEAYHSQIPAEEVRRLVDAELAALVAEAPEPTAEVTS